MLGKFSSRKEKNKYIKYKAGVLKQLGFVLTETHRMVLDSLRYDSEVSVDNYVREKIIQATEQSEEVVTN